ncbi:MAG: hypothetical protein M3N35_03760 [Candidatus Binatota bacterium]|nr:hypothetical protein [Candidatus Binatota bacterium]
MLKKVWQWIKWVKDLITKSILPAIGLAVSGVLGYFVIKFVFRKLWNISDDISDIINEMMD